MDETQLRSATPRERNDFKASGLTHLSIYILPRPTTAVSTAVLLLVATADILDILNETAKNRADPGAIDVFLVSVRLDGLAHVPMVSFAAVLSMYTMRCLWIVTTKDDGDRYTYEVEIMKSVVERPLAPGFILHKAFSGLYSRWGWGGGGERGKHRAYRGKGKVRRVQLHSK